MCTFSVEQDLRELCRAGSVCEDRSEADMAFGVHLGNIESHFHGHYGRVLSESIGGRQDIKFQVLCSGKGAA